MPAVSQKQQKFMGMVYALKTGKLKDAPKSVKKAAKSLTTKEAKKFAKTKHKGLPVRKKRKLKESADLEHFLTHRVGMSPAIQQHLHDEDLDAVSNHMDHYDSASPEEKKEIRMNIHDLAASRTQNADKPAPEEMDDEMDAQEPGPEDYDHSEEDVGDEDQDQDTVPGEDMDGDAASALASAGHGSDEDYEHNDIDSMSMEDIKKMSFKDYLVESAKKKVVVRKVAKKVMQTAKNVVHKKAVVKKVNGGKSATVVKKVKR